MNKITFLSIIFSMLLIGLGAITPSQVVLAEEEMVNCTMDAFLCPDGTWLEGLVLYVNLSAQGKK
jgi:hypothetical protein